MKITSEHVKRFVDNYHEQSGVILSTEDVLFCLQETFAETEPAKDQPKLELTEESIRQMIEKYLGKRSTNPWPQPDTVPYGVYAYMCSFPGSTFPKGTFTTCSTQESGSAPNTVSGLDQVQPRYGVSFKKE